MLQTQILNNMKKPPLNILKRLMSGTSDTTRYPTLTSREDPKGIVTSLGLSRISTMIMSGKPNRPFPDEFGVNIEEMTDGGKQAIGFVTQAVQTGEWENVEGLLSRDCVRGLRKSLQDITADERSSIAVNPDDIFFSFMPEFDFQQNKQSILLVTFSFPRLAELKGNIQLNKDSAKVVVDQMKKDIADGVITKQEASKELPIRLKQTVEELGIGDTDKLFKDNDIIVGNYRFERENSNYDWTIVELSQIDSRNAWAWIFHRRWRGRLGISLRGYDFHNVLRYDYITDWIAFMLFFNLMTGSLMSGGMISAPHS